MSKDSVFRSAAFQKNKPVAEFEEDSIARLIQQNYFREAWNNYSVQITICSGQKVLRVQPQNYLFDCDSYFRNILKEVGKPTFSKHLYFLDYGNGYKNYLAVFPISTRSSARDLPANIFIEISSRLVLKDQGYPGLLIDNTLDQAKDISEYSYAFYRNARLTQRFGNIDYGFELDHSFYHPHSHSHFYDKNGYSHFCYPINKSDFLIISRKDPSLMDVIAPFSYLFFFFTLVAFLFYAIVRFRVVFRTSFSRMSERIQVSMTSILFTSFLIIGVLIIVNIRQLNSRRDVDNLNERTHSILVELQHKFGTTETFNDTLNTALNDQMTKLSNVFFTDVNLYNPQGRLLVSSRPEIFEQGILSQLMNRRVFEQLRQAKGSFLVQEETIGRQSYNSSYMPLYNDRNQLLGYLNLPYFARQEEMKREISSFLVAFINVYVFLIILGIIISLLVSSFITHPLKILTTRLGRITLGKNNEKIVWKRKDELGKLIEEYNLMLEELSESADLLIRSEREGAGEKWPDKWLMK